MPKLKGLLKNPKNNIVKEAAWTLSNITAGNPEQIQQIIDADLFPDICDVLERGESRSKKEAAWIITNITSSGTSQQISSIVDNGILKPFCDLLGSEDARCIVVVLQGLKNMFALAAKVGSLTQFGEVCVPHIGQILHLAAIQLANSGPISSFFSCSKVSMVWIASRNCPSIETRTSTI